MASDLLETHLREALRGARERARHQGGPILATAGVPIESGDLISLFASSSNRSLACLWLGTGKHSIFGLGAAWEITASGEGRFSEVAKAWRALISEAIVAGEAGPIALGGFRFDPQQQVSDLWRGFPDASLIIPRVAVRVRNGSGRLIISEAVEADTDVDRRTGELLELWFCAQTRRTAFVEAQCVRPVAKGRTDAKERWAALVNEAVAAIGRGDLEKVVTARTLDMEFAGPIVISPVLRRLRESNPNACVFAFGRHGACFAGATPETLLILENRSFRTMALAGSISRGQEPEEDRRLGEALLASAKDRR
ncbi:MAG: chorismate-binding protein, partial [Pseudolabrys sp.]